MHRLAGLVQRLVGVDVDGRLVTYLDIRIDGRLGLCPVLAGEGAFYGKGRRIARRSLNGINENGFS